ncbi:MAG: DNA repair protein RecO [Niabella sp.]
MADKLHKTKGIVLRAVKYGDSSLIVSVYTELFGQQSYIVSGVRSASRSALHKAGFFQPAALLELVVYHNEFKNLNRIKEYRWANVYHTVLSEVVRNGVAMFMMELISKCLGEPDSNPDLFAFAEDSLLHLDTCNDSALANFPLFFALNLCHFFGFDPQPANESVRTHPQVIFDLQGGVFTSGSLPHPYYLEHRYALELVDLLMVRQPSELASVKVNAEARRHIMDALETYYRLHLPGFGRLKTLPVLREIMR